MAGGPLLRAVGGGREGRREGECKKHSKGRDVQKLLRRPHLIRKRGIRENFFGHLFAHLRYSCLLLHFSLAVREWWAAVFRGAQSASHAPNILSNLIAHAYQGGGCLRERYYFRRRLDDDRQRNALYCNRVILLRKRITSPLLVASFSIVRLLFRTLHGTSVTRHVYNYSGK